MEPLRIRDDDDSMNIQSRVASEISALHDDLASWLSGRQSRENTFFQAAFRDRLHEAFFNVQPAGIVLSRSELLHDLDNGYGHSPDFDIQILNVTVRQILCKGRHILATYEEYQRGARKSQRSENARLSTVLFEQQGDRLMWRSIHETWLPDEKHSSENFRF